MARSNRIRYNGRRAVRRATRLRRTLGAAAGGTLGFIGGNLPGAVAGASLGYRAASRAVRRPVKRRKYATNVKGGGVHRDGSDNFQTAYKKSGRKVAARKNVGKKPLKLSDKFKKSVKQVLRNYGPKGYAHERFYDRILPGNMKNLNFDVGRGYVKASSGATQVDPTTSAVMYFDPRKIYSIASCLFGGTQPQGVKDYVTGTGFNAETLQVDVLRQWVKLEMKNNTSRTLHVKIYTWQFKDNQSLLLNGSFVQDWATTVATEAANPLFGNQINVAGATTETLGMSPSFSPEMRSRFRIEEKLVMLEPGKSYVHTVQGDSMLYDFAKFQENGVVKDYHKFVKGCMISCCTDLTGSTLTPNTLPAQERPGVPLVVPTDFSGLPTHRWTKLQTEGALFTSPYGLLIESQYNYVIRMPEQAGYTVTAVPKTEQSLNNRKDHVYYVKTWDMVDQSPGIFDKNDEEPSAGATFGV